MWILWYFYEEDTPPRLLASFSTEKAAQSAFAMLQENANKTTADNPFGWVRYAHHTFNIANLELEYAPLWRDDQVGV